MTNSEKPEANDDVQFGDLFRPLLQYRRLIWQGTLAVTVAAALFGGLYLVFQPRAWTAAVGIRPTFQGGDDGEYPNGIPFSPTDITDASIVADVVAKNELQSYCSADAFRAGLGVQLTSAPLQFLSLEYQARLSDPRLTGIERQRIQEEYMGRRASMPREYDLVFSRPAACATIPDTLVLKALHDVLEGWANESQERRGVLKMRVGILTPAVFDQANADASMLVKADLVRAAVMRVLANITEVLKLPGSELVTVGENRVALAEVRIRLEDLVQARLDPLIGTAGRGLGRESARWVAQALNSATAELQASERRAEAYRQALREYSGINGAPSAASGAVAGKPSQGASDVQSLTPQIDRTFIEGIVNLSATNTTFRQEMTRRVIDAQLVAVSKASIVEHYRWLQAAIQESGGDSLSADEVNKRLTVLIAEAKDATRLFNQIYDEFSRVSFRVAPMMYRIERPAHITVARGFGRREYGILLLAVPLITAFVLAFIVLVAYHLRRFVRSTLPARSS